MPDGITHTTHTAVLAIGIGIGMATEVALHGRAEPILALWGVSGALLTPDLDTYPNITYAMMERLFGKPGRWLWEVLWRPYAALVPHRSISHVPVLGTATRIGWLLVWLVGIEGVIRGIGALLGFGGFAIPVSARVLQWLSSPQGWSAFAFLSLSDLLHEALDAVSTDTKRRAR